MAGTITHLVIADWLLEPLEIKNPALFYCGSLAPDAVMARKDYNRSMKHHTHLKDGIRTNDLHLPENMEIYKRRLLAFVEEFLDPESLNYELYLGYIIHLIADTVFTLTLRDCHVQRLINAGIDPKDKIYFGKFGHDVNLNDWRLVREYKFSYPMPDILLKENDYEIQGYVTNAELRASKDYIIRKNFLTHHEAEQPSVLTFEENWAFIERTVKEILKRMPIMY